MPIINKYHTYCHRCNKELNPGEGFCIPRNRGKFEVICSSECLLTNLSIANAFTIEVRIKMPEITGVTKELPYRKKAEDYIIKTLKETFKDYKDKLNNCRINTSNKIDENGINYYCLTAYVRNVIQRNKKHLIIIGE